MGELEFNNSMLNKFSVDSWVTKMQGDTHYDNLEDKSVATRRCDLLVADNQAEKAMKEGVTFKADKQDWTVGQMKEEATTEAEMNIDGKKGLEIAALKAIVMAEKAAAAERMAQEAEAGKVAADNALAEAVAEDEKNREDSRRLAHAPTTEADAVAFVIAAARKLQEIEVADRNRDNLSALEEVRESDERSHTGFSKSIPEINYKPVVNPDSSGFRTIFCNRDTTKDTHDTRYLLPTHGRESLDRPQSDSEMSDSVQQRFKHHNIHSSHLHEDSHHASTTNAYLSTKGKSLEINEGTYKHARKTPSPSPTPGTVKAHTHSHPQSKPEISKPARSSRPHSIPPSPSRMEAEHAPPTNDLISIKGKPRHKTPTETKSNKGFFSLFHSNPKPKVSLNSTKKKVLPNSDKKKVSPDSANKKSLRRPVGKRTPTQKRDPTPDKRKTSQMRSVTPKRPITTVPQRSLKPARNKRHTSRHKSASRSVSKGGSVKSAERKFVAENNCPAPVITSKGATKKLKSKIKSEALTDNIPTISNWECKADGTITGNISNAQNYEDGSHITTAPVTGRIVITDSGHKYRLI